jgi:hypothetical protein
MRSRWCIASVHTCPQCGHVTNLEEMDPCTSRREPGGASCESKGVAKVRGNMAMLAAPGAADIRTAHGGLLGCLYWGSSGTA